MYQASNQWDKALKLAQTKDRLNLKRICYEYARHLEAEGRSKRLVFCRLEPVSYSSHFVTEKSDSITSYLSDSKQNEIVIRRLRYILGHLIFSHFAP